MFKYNESELENAALEWLEEMDYTIVEGPDIAPNGDYTERESFHDVVLIDRLREALKRLIR